MDPHLLEQKQELEKQKQGFITGALKNGISKDIAASIFLKIEPFAEYGFNKSHAAAYAIISYQTAFLKTYYPKEFIAASMTMDISNQNKLSEFYTLFLVIGNGLTLFLIFVGLIVTHEYSFFRSVVSIILSFVAVALIVFILLLKITLFSQVYGFIKIVIMELRN